MARETGHIIRDGPLMWIVQIYVGRASIPHLQ